MVLTLDQAGALPNSLSPNTAEDGAVMMELYVINALGLYICVLKNRGFIEAVSGGGRVSDRHR
jgi:hypothetical protein